MTLTYGNTRVWIYVAIVLGVLLAAAIFVLALRIDNWSRDLTHNTAETDEDSPDPTLRPITSRYSVPVTAELVTEAAAKLQGWSEPTVESDIGSTTLRFVRTTRLLGFRDDIIVWIERDDGGSLIHAVSRSRVGKGDLGQNPRNLRELLGAARSKLERR